jgi:DUF1365 family protein
MMHPTTHTSEESAAELLTGVVMHHRLRPKEHRFSYGVFYLRLRLSKLALAGNRLFSINRFNLASFHYRDHGARDGTHPLAWIRGLLEREGLGCADGEVVLQCFPRVLGYVFNPVSFWFCEDREGRLRAVLAEVNNTFGETHSYLLARPGNAPIATNTALEARKVFHVSPFVAVSGGYRFRFNSRPTASTARIDYYDQQGPMLLTRIAGRAEPMSALRLARAFIGHPLMTLTIMARIHWQALRLWMMRTPFHAKPIAPQEKISR